MAATATRAYITNAALWHQHADSAVGEIQLLPSAASSALAWEKEEVSMQALPAEIVPI